MFYKSKGTTFLSSFSNLLDFGGDNLNFTDLNDRDVADFKDPNLPDPCFPDLRLLDPNPLVLPEVSWRGSSSDRDRVRTLRKEPSPEVTRLERTLAKLWSLKKEQLVLFVVHSHIRGQLTPTKSAPSRLALPPQ